MVAERLINTCEGKTSQELSNTMNSTFLMIEHLLNVQDPLTKVLQEDNLAASKWKSIWAMKTLVQPIAEFTSLLSSEEFTTILSALPR